MYKITEDNYDYLIKMKELLGKIIRTLICQYNRYIYRLSKFVNNDWFDHVRFRQIIGRKLNYKNPVYLNDKLMWLNKYDVNPLKSLCADKVRVHGYLEERHLDQYLVPILGCWNNTADIDFNSLPNEFVLKCNHGCGYNIIVKDKSNFSQKSACERLDKWLKEDYSKACNEYHYSHIQPLIFAEEYIPSFDDGGIVDYKIHCIGNKAEWILVCSERQKTGHPQLSAYTLDWKPLDCLKTPYGTPIKKPKYLNEMIEIANKIAKDFHFVRVDFYETEDQLYIGELTFTPEGNTISYYKDDFLYEQGAKLILPV